MENKLIYSSSPHIKAQRTTRRIMIDVCIALLPATIMGIIYFGLYALLLVALSVAFAVIGEYLYLLIAGKTFKEITDRFDFSSVVTGLLIGLTIGTNYPFYTPIFGSLFAVVAVKMLFGGTGKNVVNPAIAGRVFIFISFQWAVGAWLFPAIGSVFGQTAETSATAVVNVSQGIIPKLSVLDMLLGTGMQGCIGETCKLALLAGGIYLAIRRVINIMYPFIYIALAGITTVLIFGFDFALFLPSILSGGLILGAIFMATDYTTTPNTTLGNTVYFVFLGVLTAVLRYATNMETVSFAILLMNLTVPLIDKFILNKPFGYKKPQKAKEAK
ncbi:MAG: RnfABCDGE type electron transport complex subunit D [Clostridia bacterium]|nr:RnfABCDGE type electron transport complex subunit D [Clostridia bacterium]